MRAEPPSPDVQTPAPQPVAIYTRVSTDNQVGGRFDSCESQAAYCREEIEKQRAAGWYEVACLTDAAYSGSTMDRPGIRALKRMIEAGEVKVVLIYKLERVLRSTDEWVPFKAFLKTHGCRLASATEDISESTPSGRLKNNLMMSFSQYERENTAEKTRAKMLQQAKRGIWNGGSIPYGYSYDRNTQSLLPHPEEATVVRRIYEHAASLKSLTDLANELNAEGLRTKARIWRRRDGTELAVGQRLFRSDGLRLMIKNPIYRGAVKFAGQEYASRHSGLVSAELWEKARAATVETEPRPVYLPRESDIHNHLLKGLAWCGACGRAMVPNDSGKKSISGARYRYYTCSLVMRETAAAPCEVGRLSADALEKSVAALLGEASRHPSVIAEMVQTSRSHRKTDRAALQTEVNELKTTLADLDKQLRNCADAVAQGGASALREQLVRRAEELNAERQSVLIREERKRQELALCDATALEETRIRENLQKFGQVVEHLETAQRKELVRLMVERVEIRLARTGALAPSDIESAQRSRLMELRIKLHLTELVHGMQARSASERANPRIFGRPLSLTGRVDFTHAQRGEVSLVTPFSRLVRLNDRERKVSTPKAVPRHPILRAIEWQQMLDEKAVRHRFALAQLAGVTPGAVTKTLRLNKLNPEICQFLAGLKSRAEIWHFSLTRMGSLAKLPPEIQSVAFERMRRQFTEKQATLGIETGTGQTVSVSVKEAPKSGPRLSAS